MPHSYSLVKVNSAMSNLITYPLPSNMVADPVRPSQILIANAQPQTVFRKPHMITELQTLPKWQPRTGRNDNFIKWYDALVSAEADLETA